MEDLDYGKMNKELFVNAEEVYGIEKISLLRSWIYDIGMCIMFNTFKW